jgi:hypothetical protein
MLRTSLHLLSVLSLDNMHWVAVHTSNQFNLVEIFLFLQTEREHQRARVHIEELVAYLLAVGHLQIGVNYQFRVSPEWFQRDSSSCGLFALGVVISLARGHRIKLDCSDSAGRQQDWRRYFAQVVVAAAQATTAGTSDKTRSDPAIDLTEDHDVDLTGDD